MLHYMYAWIFRRVSIMLEEISNVYFKSIKQLAESICAEYAASLIDVKCEKVVNNGEDWINIDFLVDVDSGQQLADMDYQLVMKMSLHPEKFIENNTSIIASFEYGEYNNADSP